MKSFRELISKILCEFDMFAVEPTLRHKQQPFSSTSGLGFISLLIYGFFIWLFIKSLRQVVIMNSNQINTSQTLDKNYQNRSLTNFMFGVQIPPQYTIPQENRSTIIQAYNLTELRTYFTFDIAIIPYNSKDYIYQTLKACEPQDWKALGDNYQKYFEENQLFNSLCPSSPLNITDIATESSFIFINVYNCVDDPAAGVSGCKSFSQIKKVKDSIIGNYGHFPLWVDYLVSVPQVGEPNPAKYVVDTKRFAASNNFSEIGFVGFDSFRVTTDKSIWPIVIQQEQVQGIYTSQTFHTYSNFDENSQYPTYFTVYSYMRPSVHVFERNITKIDTVISYVGGLLGIVLVFLGFFFQSYNQYRYQLKVGQSSFNYYSDGNLIKQKNLNPWVYVKYSLWDWIALLCDKQMNWQGCIEMDETREEAIFMMDVQKFFRRLQFLERAIMRESDQNMVYSLTLVEPGSIEDIRKKRKMLDYYQEIIRLQTCPCVQDALQAPQKFNEEPKKMVQFLIHSTVLPSAKNDGEGIKQVNQDKAVDKNDNIQQVVKLPGGTVQIQQSIQSIKLSLMKDLGLEHEEQICYKIANYRGISYQAKQLQIDPDFMQIEKQMTQSFLSLSPQRKSQVILNMPIKILHRLRFKAIQLKKQNPNKKEIEKEKDQVKQLFMGLTQISNKNQMN